MRLREKIIIILSSVPFISFILIIYSSLLGIIQPINSNDNEVGLSLMGLSMFLPITTFQYLNPKEVGGVLGYRMLYYSKNREEYLKIIGLIFVVIILISYTIGLILFLF
jgi:hypothetical protein